MASVTLKGICKDYDGVQVSRDINLTIEDGEFVVFVGPSGCGKSTLLRMIAGLEDISSGDLFIGDKRVNNAPPRARGIGMVFQSYALYPHMNVAENMGFGLKLAGQTQHEINRRVLEVAKILQLEPLLNRKPKDLSGGQRQRVAIGRTLVREPKVFLFDEPLSNLDAALRVQMRIEISRLHQKLKATMIYVTHDQVEAMTLADKIVALDMGSVAQVGRPLELYHYPGNRFVAGFIGSPQMNFLPATAMAVNAQSATVQLASGSAVTVPVDASSVKSGEAVTLGIRPEHFTRDSDADLVLEGRVILVEQLGYHTLVHAQIPGYNDPVTLSREGTFRIREDDPISLGLRAADCHIFDKDNQACPRLIREADIGF